MPATSANKAGVAAGFYRNTGTYGSPSWTIQPFVHSVTLTENWDAVEAGMRATRAKTKMKARVEISVSVQVKADAADAGYQAMRAAHANPTTVIDLLILDGLITVEGALGVRGEFLVVSLGQPQEIDGSIYDTFELQPTWTSNAVGPSSVVMGASSTPTFTAF